MLSVAVKAKRESVWSRPDVELVIVMGRACTTRVRLLSESESARVHIRGLIARVQLRCQSAIPSHGIVPPQRVSEVTRTGSSHA